MSETLAPRKLCKHGLTDQTAIDVKTVVEDFRSRRRTTVITFKCEDHKSYGTFSFEETI